MLHDVFSMLFIVYKCYYVSYDIHALLIRFILPSSNVAML